MSVFKIILKKQFHHFQSRELLITYRLLSRKWIFAAAALIIIVLGSVAALSFMMYRTGTVTVIRDVKLIDDLVKGDSHTWVKNLEWSPDGSKIMFRKGYLICPKDEQGRPAGSPDTIWKI